MRHCHCYTTRDLTTHTNNTQIWVTGWQFACQVEIEARWNDSEILITCCLIGLLVGFPFQHSSVSKQCNDANHNEENNAENKYHATIFICPIASFRDPVESRGGQFGRNYFNGSHFVRLWAEVFSAVLTRRRLSIQNSIVSMNVSELLSRQQCGPRIVVE